MGTPRCPACGEWTVVCKVDQLVDYARGKAAVKVSQVAPPPYCPMCGAEWLVGMLMDEAEWILSGEEGSDGRED